MTQDRTINAAALQWDVRRGEVEANLATATGLIQEASEAEAQLVVMPEMWATSFMGEEAEGTREAVDRAEAAVTTLAGDLGLVLIGSNYEFAADGSIYNRAKLVDRGDLAGEYRKMHLFSPHGEDRFFAHGESWLVADTSIGRVAAAICYDLRFPELIRHLFLAGAELLLVPAQWPAPRDQHWRTLVKARAIENQWFVVASNRCGNEPSLINETDVSFPGNSLIVDPTGTVLAEGNGEAGVFADELDLKEVRIVRRAIPISKDRRVDAYGRFEL
ncbi:MAG: carbon-nitrogen hydrolase [Planctomycetes bacterium]|jgi:predicted amidohydrolase|nr:carbon-nitrogen hydrolase [Planctomycetota bacterium]MDP6424932.1 nitrilase-related carbon-nitrogen hydrolase [Planctomycetota bacterium]